MAVVEVGVKPSRREQFLVGTALDHVAVVHDENHVGVADGGEAVRDDEARAPRSTHPWPFG